MRVNDIIMGPKPGQTSVEPVQEREPEKRPPACKLHPSMNVHTTNLIINLETWHPAREDMNLMPLAHKFDCLLKCLTLSSALEWKKIAEYKANPAGSSG